MPKLILNPGTPQAREFELKAGANYLGRGFANDLKIEDPSVSTSHAQILVNGAAITIKDLGSTNGTFINRSQIREAVLQAGQLLHLGGVEMVIAGAAPSAPAAPAPAPPAGGLRFAPRAATAAIAGLAAEPEEEPAPVASPAAGREFASGMVDAPAGKSACKYHHKTAGQWLCQKCNELFCSLCVSNKRTGEGTVRLCRKCGTACVPVRAKLVASKEKQLKVYSDGVVLLRSLGFGFGAALLTALLWTGVSRLIGVDVPFIFCIVAGALCGYAVKFACQDRPGAIFSSITVVFCILGSVLGKLGMIAATHLTTNSSTSLFTALIGLMVGSFLAWKIGGGDF